MGVAEDYGDVVQDKCRVFMFVPGRLQSVERGVLGYYSGAASFLAWASWELPTSMLCGLLVGCLTRTHRLLISLW